MWRQYATMVHTRRRQAVKIPSATQQEAIMARISPSEKVPKQMQDIFNAIVARTDTVCTTHLDEEYAHLARQATAALCRQRPSPLATGHLKTWACGLVYAVGFANFLFCKCQTPSVCAAVYFSSFGVRLTTHAATAA